MPAYDAAVTTPTAVLRLVTGTLRAAQSTHAEARGGQHIDRGGPGEAATLTQWSESSETVHKQNDELLLLLLHTEQC